MGDIGGWIREESDFIFHTGEQGKVEESMREMAAIEALKSEKSEKEVSHGVFCVEWTLTFFVGG